MSAWRMSKELLNLYFWALNGLFLLLVNCDFCDYKSRKRERDRVQGWNWQLGGGASRLMRNSWADLWGDQVSVIGRETLRRRVSGKGTNRPEWFQIRFSGFLLLVASIAAGTRWGHSTRIKDCITAHGAPCTMNLQRNAITSFAASTKWEKISMRQPLFVCHSRLWFRPVWCICRHTEACGSELVEEQKYQSGCDAAEHPGAILAPIANCTPLQETQHLCTGALARHCSQKEKGAVTPTTVRWSLVM